MTRVTLFETDILDSGEDFHFSRLVLSNRKPKSLHVQDYHEVFWIHNGKARLHLDGETKILTEGDLVFLPPDCPHGLQGVGVESHVVNLVLRRARVDDLIARHPMIKDWLDPTLGTPRFAHRDIRALSQLSHRAVALERAPRSLLYLEAFLLPLVAELTRERMELPTTAPDWLCTALVACEDPSVFKDGAAGLVAQCGKAHAHVSRTMQTHLGQTPSDYMNDLRMSYAARMLKGTPDPLAEIASEIGLHNMSHFHRLFRSRFRMTPRQYRTKHQKGVVQPV